jgi:flagellar basal-body rod modification protein FlgD
MDLSSLQSASAQPGLSGALQGSQTELDRDAFMQLLVAQLTNQDPLEPVKNEDFTAQLAQFSSLEELEGMNSMLETLTILQQGNALLSQLSESSALIGKQVDWSDPELGFEGEGVVDSVELIEGITYLKIGENSVPLAFVTQVQEPGADSATDDGDEAVDEASETGADDEQDA